MEKGFEKGMSDNLPKVDEMMMALYFTESPNFTSAEIRGIKAQRSARDSYGDNAIGFVQLKREGSICTVKATITPEHKIHHKGYPVTAVIDEGSETVVSITCDGCVAGSGGCKHVIAFLWWLHRKSEAPPVTSVECYWRKSTLSLVGSKTKLKKAVDIGGKSAKKLPPSDGSSRDEFAQLYLDEKLPTMQLSTYYCPPSNIEKLSLHYLRREFFCCNISNRSPEEFYLFLKTKINTNDCDLAEKETISQSENPLWHHLRFARITASKLHAASRCQTLDGSLVEQVLGAKIKDTAAMERGRRLEGQVRKVLGSKLNTRIEKCGLFLHPEFPIFGASPDGITQDFVIEIKCPNSVETANKYFCGNNPAEKHYAQIQLQMLFSKREKGCFCVADPLFEDNQEFKEIWVTLDRDYVLDTISKAYKFWAKAVYPKLQ